MRYVHEKFISFYECTRKAFLNETRTLGIYGNMEMAEVKKLHPRMERGDLKTLKKIRVFQIPDENV